MQDMEMWPLYCRAGNCGKICSGKPNKRFTVLENVIFKNHITLFV